MKVLLTGGRGMVGRNVCAHPAAANHDLITPSRTELDLTDSAAAAAYVATVAPDVVIHCAGRVGGIQANIADPVGYLTENLAMGVNTVLAARDAGVPRLLNLGSSCMYPHAAPNPLSEDLVLGGALEPTNEGYALAKITVARLCDYVSRTVPGLAYRTLIPCNIYGLYDKFDPQVSHLVPAIIRKVHEALVTGNDTVEVWGDGTARREFMFSVDLADGIWNMIERFDELPNLMNIGTGVDYAIDDYYETAARVIGWKGRLRHNLSRPVGMKQKLVSVARQELLGWRSRTTLDEGMAQTYTYFLAEHI